MSFLLDTNAVAALIDSASQTARRRLKRARATKSLVAISSIALHELWYGVALSTYQIENAANLRKLLSSGIEALPFDEEDAMRAGEVRAILQKSGTPIGPYDVLIAGQALSKSMTLVTANVREFARIEGLKWQDWTAAAGS